MDMFLAKIIERRNTVGGDVDKFIEEGDTIAALIFTNILIELHKVQRLYETTQRTTASAPNTTPTVTRGKSEDNKR